MADRDLNDARYDATRTTAGTTGATTGAATDLRRLSELDDYEVADGYPDIRGWTVKTPDGQTLGKVDDLVVSVREMRVRYMDVDVDRSLRSAAADAVTPKGAERGHALVPIGTATLRDDGDDVIVNSLSGADLASYPLYDRQAGITREYEQSLRGRYDRGYAAAAGTAATTDSLTNPVAGSDAKEGTIGGWGATTSGDDFYGSEHYDESRLYESRRNRSTSGDANVDYTTSRATGDASVGIPTTQEGVGGMSASGTGATGATGATGRSSVLRQRTGTTRGTTGEAGMSGAADRATNSGFADRVADKADDLKDRVDGNPASRPGPDATDRRI